MARSRLDRLAEPEVVAALQELGARCADDLIPLLYAQDEATAMRAAWTLGQIGGKRHSGALLHVLQGNRPGLWMQSATSLSLLESKRPIRALTALTLDRARPAEQRYAAAYVLAFSSAALNDPRHGEALRSVFTTILADQQEPPQLRGQAAEGLGNMFGGCFGDSDQPDAAYDAAGQILIAALRDGEPEVRFWAAFALGALGYRPALPVLRELADHDGGRFGGWWTVGEEASDAIDRIEGREPPDRNMTGELTD